MNTDIDKYLEELRTKMQELHVKLEKIENDIREEEIAYSFKKQEVQEKAKSALESYKGEGLGVDTLSAEKGLPKLQKEDILKVLTAVYT